MVRPLPLASCRGCCSRARLRAGLCGQCLCSSWSRSVLWLLVLFLLFLLCDVVLAVLPPWSSQGGFRPVCCFVCMVHVAFFAGCLGLASSHFCLMILGACTSACLFELSNICVCWCPLLFAAPMTSCVRVSVVCGQGVLYYVLWFALLNGLSICMLVRAGL